MMLIGVRTSNLKTLKAAAVTLPMTAAPVYLADDCCLLLNVGGVVVTHCGPIPMTCGSCSCRKHIVNLVTGVSRLLVLDCGTIFHPDYGGRDCPSTPLDSL